MAEEPPPLFTREVADALIAPSILSADFAHLERECRAVLDEGADLLHLDVMDGHFVPNLSMGPALCRSLRRHLPDTFLDVHMMVSNPGRFITPFAEAGASSLTIHLECEDDLIEVARDVHRHGLAAGLAIKPDSDVALMEPLLHHFDLLLVMSVHPGFSGQAFIPEVLETTRHLRALARPTQHIEMDGGIGPETAASCREAGCDVLVAASAIFNHEDYGSVIAALRGAAGRFPAT